MDDLTITVKHLQRGQPRPYADHAYEAEITITGSKSWHRLGNDQMKHLIKAVVHGFTEDKDDGSMNSYYRPRLKALTKVSEQRLSGESLGPQREVWRARVEVPFTD